MRLQTRFTGRIMSGRSKKDPTKSIDISNLHMIGKHDKMNIAKSSIDVVPSLKLINPWKEIHGLDLNHRIIVNSPNLKWSANSNKVDGGSHKKSSVTVP